MKTAVLLIGHGSRDKEGNEEFLRLVEAVRSRLPGSSVLHAYLEFEKPTIVDGIHQCVQGGAERLLIAPVILFAAKHAKEDIPREIEKGLDIGLRVPYCYLEPFGAQLEMVEKVEVQIRSLGKGQSLNRVLFVGRGSSDRAANQDFIDLVHLFARMYQYPQVEYCFMAFEKPSLEEKIEALSSGSENWIVVPYFLFTGSLLSRLRESVRKIDLSGSRFRLLEPLGKDTQLADILYQKVQTVLN